MNHYHKDIDKNGIAIYYRSGRRFVRANKEQAELEIQAGLATVEDYVPNKPVSEMTDRQLLAACRSSVKFSGKVFSHQQEQLDARGLSI